MPTADDFLRAILDDPDDDAPRLVYADWLEERGDPRGEFIRLQCALARQDEEGEEDDYWLLRERERWLLAQHGKGWVGPLRQFVKRWRFHRGFVEEIGLPATAFLQHAEQFMRLAPIRQARLTEAAEHLRELAACPQLGQLTGLDLSEQNLHTRNAGPLFRSKHLGRLRRLNLSGTKLCNDTGLCWLAERETLANLSALDVSYFRRLRARTYGDEDAADGRLCLLASGVEALARFQGLRELRMTNYQGAITTHALDALLATGLLGRLTSLDVSRSMLFSWDWRGAGQFFKSPQWANLHHLCLARAFAEIPDLFTGTSTFALRSLDLSGPGPLFEGDPLERMLRSRRLPELRRLTLRNNRLGPGQLKALSNAKHLPKLRYLDLDQNEFHSSAGFLAGSLLAQLRVLRLQGPGTSSYPEHSHPGMKDKGVGVLARSARFDNLLRLDLGNQEIGDKGLTALAGSQGLPELRTLEMWNNKIGAKGLQAILNSDALPNLLWLDVRSNPVPASAHATLRQRFGVGGRYGQGRSVENEEQRRKFQDGEDYDDDDD